MIGPCPFLCSNKTSLGYCKTTGCINSRYYNMIVDCKVNDAIECINFFIDENDEDDIGEYM